MAAITLYRRSTANPLGGQRRSLVTLPWCRGRSFLENATRFSRLPGSMAPERLLLRKTLRGFPGYGVRRRVDNGAALSTTPILRASCAPCRSRVTCAPT